MRVTTIGEFRKKSKQFLDDIYNDSEELLILRPGGKDVVLISLDEYNAMKETLYLFSTTANRKHMEQGLDEIRQGKTRKVYINDLWK